jgi:spermidine synthase
VQAALISPPHLHWLFSDAPRQWFQQNVGEGGVVNRDFSPHILTKHLFYTTTRLNPGIKPFLELLGELRTAHLAAFIIATTIFIVILAGNRSRVAVNWMIATTGFTAMLLELAFFCIFQLSQGVMLRTLGFLVAVFMTGLWGGSRISSGAPASPGGDAQRLFAGEAVLLVLCGLLWAISTGGSMAAALTAAPYLLLLPLIFLAGLAAGMQFPPAARATTDGFVPGTAQVYGFDLLGGWLGGLFGGALLLPLLGFADVAVLLLVLKGGSILCLYLNWKRDKI